MRSPEREGGRWFIDLDDATAHERDDTINAFVAALVAADGFDDVVREDREVVSVRSRLSGDDVRAVVASTWAALIA